MVYAVFWKIQHCYDFFQKEMLILSQFGKIGWKPSIFFSEMKSNAWRATLYLKNWKSLRFCPKFAKFPRKICQKNWRYSSWKGRKCEVSTFEKCQKSHTTPQIFFWGRKLQISKLFKQSNLSANKAIFSKMNESARF